MKRNFIETPNSAWKWRRIANEFKNKWNFPNCLGAIDGKHVVMQAPARSGSDFFNYKKTHSIVLLAVCDANYIFTMVDIGDAGRQSDGGVYKNSKLGYAINNNLINRPLPSALNVVEKVYPYVFVADDAFQMTHIMLKPYPRFANDISKKVFNYRLSRARRVIENSFGIAAARFKVFRRPIIAKVESVRSITKAVVALHNFLMISQNDYGECTYCPETMVDQDSHTCFRSGTWRKKTVGFNGLLPIKATGSNNYNSTAKDIRDDFKDYFNSVNGSVSWQWDYVNRTIDPFDI